MGDPHSSNTGTKVPKSRQGRASCGRFGAGAMHSGRPPACRNHGVLWVLRLSALARPGPEPIDRSGSVGSAKRSSTMLRDNRGEGLHRIK